MCARMCECVCLRLCVRVCARVFVCVFKHLCVRACVHARVYLSLPLCVRPFRVAFELTYARAFACSPRGCPRVRARYPCAVARLQRHRRRWRSRARARTRRAGVRRPGRAAPSHDCSAHDIRRCSRTWRSCRCGEMRSRTAARRRFGCSSKVAALRTHVATLRPHVATLRPLVATGCTAQQRQQGSDTARCLRAPRPGPHATCHGRIASGMVSAVCPLLHGDALRCLLHSVRCTLSVVCCIFSVARSPCILTVAHSPLSVVRCMVSVVCCAPHGRKCWSAVPARAAARIEPVRHRRIGGDRRRADGPSHSAGAQPLCARAQMWVAGVSPVPAQMWRKLSEPVADVARSSPI